MSNKTMKRYNIINPHELRITNEFGSFEEMKEYLKKYKFSNIRSVSDSVMNIGGKLWDKRNNPTDYRYVFICIRETNHEIKFITSALSPTWCMERSEWTNGLYTAVITMRRDFYNKRYIPKITVFRKSDELTRFNDDNPNLLVNRNRYVAYENIEEAEVRFEELEKVAIRYLKMHTI